ncbi:MAG: carboxypeptidase regulatory-like domain-containing protein [Hydrotalea sp.]|jgi:hypothetical protein|nr:carboxypeptidase regulatory-like domain-containing protein [Hydrotalea sp.]
MKRVLFLLMIASSWVACKKESQPAVATGSIGGSLQTFDDKLTALSDAAGFTVTLSNPAATNMTTTTDATGRFSFSGVPYDSYELSFSKTGYGTYRIFGLSHDSASTQIPHFSVGRTSTTTVSSLSVSGSTFQGESGVRFTYTVAPTPTTTNRAFVRYFLGTSNMVSPNNYTAVSDLINFTNLSAETGFTQRALISMGFTTGQTVWVRMYGDSWRSNDYFDPNLRTRVFPNLNSTSPAAISFVVP